eukprot:TRINITY_DN5894_c1_g4_i1.p1 TRINITY_DN5894_c1_g4~~TRINITY_DN5894_c1_g4_i1.p1  ORF type:complete len:1071 (+),score=316.22 TRINITY_DN5894_c1_g4_i1:177-3389(+)
MAAAVAAAAASAEPAGAADAWGDPFGEQAEDAAVDEAEGEVALEITYVDPGDGKLCKRDVFADPKDWQFTWYKTRLLISSDLVNLLSEAAVTREARSDVVHKMLERVRLGYLCDLERIRNIVSKAVKAIPATPAVSAAAAADPEVCPVHFFTTDRYLDQWELERTQEAIRMAERDVLADIKDMQQKINQFGGGNWRQILNHMLKNGHTPMHLTETLLHHFNPPEDERRALDNELTNGLRDKYDELEIVVKSMDKELDDERRRGPDLEVKSGMQRQRIDDLREQLADIRAKLQIEPEREVFGGIVRKTVTKKEAPVFEEVKPQDVGPLFAELLMQWEAKLRGIREEIDRLKKILAEWQKRLREPDETEALLKLLREWIAKLEKLRSKAKVLFDKRDRLRARLDELLARLSESTEAVATVSAEVESLPPPDPRSQIAAQLRRQLRKFEAQNRELLKKIAAMKQRIAGLKYELKKLYKKLGWEWDMSESECEDDDERPYWERRKLAIGGQEPVKGADGKLRYANKDFNPRDFVFAEREFKMKRLKAKMSKLKSEMRATVHSQLMAKHTAAVDERPKTSFERDARSTADGSVSGGAAGGAPRPFSSADVSTSVGSAVQQLSISREDLDLLPAWAHDSKEVEWRVVQLVQLQDLTGVLTGKLLRCAGGFLEALPANEAPLSGLRLRFKAALEDLHRCTSSAAASDEETDGGDGEEEERALASACAAARVLMEEAVSLGGDVAGIITAMQHAADFSGLERRLVEVRRSERRLRLELQCVEGRGRDAFGGLRISRKVRAASAAAAAAAGLVPPRSPESAFAAAAALLGNSRSSSGFLAPPRGGSGGSPTSASPQRSPSSGSAEEYEQSFWDSASPRAPEEGGAPATSAPRVSVSRQKRPRRGSRGKPDVDLGFRPDGAGEEPLENWSLFKVSKSTDLGSTQMGSTGMSFYSGASSLGRHKQRLADSTATKALASNQGFQEYVAQLRSGSAPQEMWSSSSAPNLRATAPEPKVKQPSLPQLVTASRGGSGSGRAAAGKSSGTSASGSGLADGSPCRPKLRLQFCKSATSRNFKTWGFA